MALCKLGCEAPSWSSDQPHQGSARKDDSSRTEGLNGFDGRHFGNVMAEHILDAVSQRDGRRRAASAASLKMQEHRSRTAVEALEDDIAAVAGHRRAHTRLQKLL